MSKNRVLLLRKASRIEEAVFTKIVGKLVKNSMVELYRETSNDETCGAILKNVIETPTYEVFKKKFGEGNTGKFIISIVENFTDINYALMEAKTDKELEDAEGKDFVDEKLDKKMDEELKDVDFSKNVKADVAEIIVDDQQRAEEEKEKEKKLATTLDEDMDDNKKASTDIPEDKEEKADAVGDEDEDANGENHKELTDEFGFEVPKIAESVAASLDASGQFDPHEASKLTTTMITALRLAESLSLLTPDRKEDLRRELNASVN